MSAECVLEFFRCMKVRGEKRNRWKDGSTDRIDFAKWAVQETDGGADHRTVKKMG